MESTPNPKLQKSSDKHLPSKSKYSPQGDDNKGERFVAVLEIPPVESAQTAVKISIVSDIKKGKK
jgi:hypothetical protein